MDDSTLLELEALKTEREAWAGAHAYDPCQASHDKLMGIASRIRALATPAEPTTADEAVVEDDKRRQCWTVWRLGARVNVSLFESRIRRQARSYVDPPGEVVHMVELRPGEHIATGASEIPEELKALVRASCEILRMPTLQSENQLRDAVNALPSHLLRACGIEER